MKRSTQQAIGEPLMAMRSGVIPSDEWFHHECSPLELTIFGDICLAANIDTKRRRPGKRFYDLTDDEAAAVHEVGARYGLTARQSEQLLSRLCMVAGKRGQSPAAFARFWRAMRTEFSP